MYPPRRWGGCLLVLRLRRGLGYDGSFFCCRGKGFSLGGSLPVRPLLVGVGDGVEVFTPVTVVLSEGPPYSPRFQFTKITRRKMHCVHIFFFQFSCLEIAHRQIHIDRQTSEKGIIVVFAGARNDRGMKPGYVLRHGCSGISLLLRSKLT